MSDGGLHVKYSEQAEAHLDEAYRWLMSLPMSGNDAFDAAERWLAGLHALVQKEAEVQGGRAVMFRRRLAPDSTPERDRFLLLYRTGQGRRGSAWHIVYELHDTDEDGRTDTLRIVRIRHAGSGAAG
jgi:plasmid stabilization system protein ParE